MLTIEQLFDEEFYLAQNQGVREAVEAGMLSSGFDHFIEFGQFEGRAPSAFFETSFYLDTNIDALEGIEAGETTAVGHFLNVGQFEGRDPHPLFDTNFYLSDSELAAALEAAGLTAIEHFINFGQFEGRNPSAFFDTNFYLQQNPEVEGFVNDGLFESPFEHFVLVGLLENSPSTPPELTDSLLGIDGDFGLLGTSEISDFVGNEDAVDIYSFLLNEPSNLQVVLGGLTGDADLELIEDLNGNNVIDSLEVFASSKQLGTLNEEVNVVLEEGTYFVRVSQFEGDTNYNLSLEASPSI